MGDLTKLNIIERFWKRNTKLYVTGFSWGVSSIIFILGYLFKWASTTEYNYYFFVWDEFTYYIVVVIYSFFNLAFCLRLIYLMFIDLRTYLALEEMGIVLRIDKEFHNENEKKEYHFAFIKGLDHFKSRISTLINKSSYLYPMRRFSAIKMNKDLDLCFTIFNEELQNEFFSDHSKLTDGSQNEWVERFQKFYSDIVEIIYNPEAKFEPGRFTRSSRVDVFPLYFKINEYNKQHMKTSVKIYYDRKKEIDDYYSTLSESENRIIQLKLDIIKDGIIAFVSAILGVVFGFIISNAI